MSLHRQLVLDLREISSLTRASVELCGDDGVRICTRRQKGENAIVVRGPEPELRQFLAGFKAGWLHAQATEDAPQVTNERKT